MWKLSLVAAVVAALALPAFADRRVRTYTTKRGAVVQSHSRTRENRTQVDNYSTKGNRNPYTGAKGSKKARR